MKITRSRITTLGVLIAALSLPLFPGSAALSQERAGETVARTLEEGVSLMQRGKLDEALNRFNTVLVLEPENGEAHYRIGQVYIRKGEREKGLEFVKQAVELEPRNVRVSLELAAMYEQSGMLDEAISEYQRLLSTGSRDKRLKEAEKKLSLATGKSLARKGELNAALLLFNGLLLEYRNDPLVLFNIGATYLLLNRAEEAERAFKQLVEMQPKNILAHLNLASIYERTGRVPDALKHLKIIIDLDAPGNITKNAKVKYYVIQARQHFRERKWEAARNTFKTVLEVDPEATEALFNLGLINIQLGNVQAAEEAFLKVLEITPDDFSARLNLGGFYFDIGRVDDAVKHFQYIIENDKDGRYRTQASLRLNMVHTILADKALEMGNVEDSLREYEKAVDYYPGNIKAYFNRGLILIQQKKYAEARDAFLEVVRLDPKNLRGRLNLANIYEQLDELTKAAEHYEAVLKIDPNSREGRVARQKWKITKARGLWAEHKLTEAVEVLGEIVAENPGNVEANFYLGIILSAKGQLRAAAKAYQRVLEARPGNHRVKILLAKLYEQLELEELAAGEYRTIIFEGGEPDVVAEARSRLAIVESRLNGFANNLGYSFAFDSNANLNDKDPGREVRSDLSFDIVYAHKLRDDLKFRLNVKPIYSTFHVGQFDFISADVNYVLRKGVPERNWSFTYGHQEMSGLLSEQSVSKASNYTLERGMKLFLPAAFGLAPVGLTGERVPTALTLRLGVSTVAAYEPVEVRSVSPTIGAALSQGLKWGVSATGGLQASVRRNLEQNEAVQLFTTTNAVSGQQEEYTLKTFDSRDYEFNSVGANLGLNKVLSPGIRASLGGGVNYTHYVNVDSASQNEKRKSAMVSISAQLFYEFHKDISFFGALSWQRSLSTLPVSDFDRPTVDETVRNFQSTALGAYTRYSVSGGMSMNF